MFQRLKGAIDSRIAEEQARQRAAQQQSPSSSSTPPRSSTSRALSPSTRASRSNESGTEKSLNVKGPDPAEFVIGDDDVPSRTATPRPAPDKAGAGIQGNDDDKTGSWVKGEGGGNEKMNDDRPGTLPADVQAKLRKLAKMESKYQELLRSYRLAHARVSAIEPFEASLRENTPLTSINDPSAFVEYLSQMNLKSDMVMEELKRVSHEKDTFKQKLDDAELQTRQAYDELAKVRNENANDAPTEGDNKGSIDAGELSSPNASAAVSGATVSSETSTEVGQSQQWGDEFFNHDAELPRLQSELKEREAAITDLRIKNETLEADLAVARESAKELMQKIELTATESESLRSQLEAANKLLEHDKTAQERDQASMKKLTSDLEGAQREFEYLNSSKDDTERSGVIQRLSDEAARLHDELANSRSEQAHYEKRNQTLSELVKTMKSQLKESELAMGREYSNTDSLRQEIDRLNHEMAQNKKDAPETEIRETTSTNLNAAATSTPADSLASAKKKNKKKKKSGRQNESAVGSTSNAIASVDAPLANGAGTGTIDNDASDRIGELENQVQSLQMQVKEKDAAIERLNSKLKDQDALNEEIEGLKDDIINVGQEHVEAKDKIKTLMAEKTTLEDHAKSLETEIAELQSSSATTNAQSEEARHTLAANFEELKVKASALEFDLSAAQKLAASRFKDLTELRDILQKAQPELTALRSEANDLRTSKGELEAKIAELQELELRERDLRSQLTKEKNHASERDEEIKTLKGKISQYENERLALEDALGKIQKDLQGTAAEKAELTETNKRVLKDLEQAQEEIKSTRATINQLQQQIVKVTTDFENLREEIDLKTAQHASAQSLMASMRDQTNEMATQMKEARERCDSLEEELADAHRLMSERNRESETMRRLLADAERRTESRIKEMRDQLDQAVEGRDRAEDEASNAARRRTKEMEELKVQVRDAEKKLKQETVAKEENERAKEFLRQQQEEIQQQAERATRELNEVRQAMNQLRDALDECERQARVLDKEKGDLRRTVQETQQRLEKLQKANKSMSDELKSLQGAKFRAVDSSIHSSRSSIELSPSRGRLASPILKGRAPSIQSADTSGPSGGASSIDFVYLKNVLLQFLEQREKKHQMQLVPVLGTLLHFDRGDEQKLMAAISAR